MTPDSLLESQLTGWLREHRNILLKVAGSFATEPAEQAELFQDMTIELWRSLPKFKGDSKASTWIYRVCLNTALTWRRSERKRHSSQTPLELAPELACATPCPGRLHEKDEIMQQLFQHIHSLPRTDRSLIILHLDGLSYREIGTITGLSETHVGVSLSRIRRKLGESMKEVRREF